MIDFDHKNHVVSKEWLTRTLIQNGFLTSGEVIGVEQKKSRLGGPLTSKFLDVEVKYSTSSRGECPTSCLAKIGKPGWFANAKREAQFYEQVVGGDKSESLLESYGTSTSEQEQSAIILLKDMGDDGVYGEWPVPPAIEDSERAVRLLARVHANWWESSILGSEGFERQSEKWIDEVFGLRRTFYEGFSIRMGDRLSAARRALIEKILDQYPALLKQRANETSTQTLIHADSHFGNFLFLNDKTRPPILIDWQSWRIGFGASDLAYMLGLSWSLERRQRYEKDLLKTYLGELHLNQVEYGFEDLWYDYRFDMIAQLLLPISFAQIGLAANVWWPQLELACSAFDDLECNEFLQ